MQNREMKGGVFFLVSVISLSAFTDHSRADDLVRVKTSLYELKSDVSESAPQEELAKLGATVEGDLNLLRFESSTVTPSGKWTTSKKTKSFHYPGKYGATQLFRSKADKRVYSIEATSETSHPGTVLVPGHATDFIQKELGTTVKLKPSLRKDGVIQIEGTVTEVTLVSLAAANEVPIITSRKTSEASREKEVGRDTQKAPFFATSETSLSSRIQDNGTPHYLVIKMKRSCLAGSVENQPGSMKAKGNRNITTSGSSDSSMLNIFPARPDEVVPVLVAMRAERIKPLAKAPSAKGGKILLQVHFIEADKDLDAPHPVMNKSKFELLIRTLNQQKGVDLLTAPAVTTVSGRSAKIDVGREFIFPTAYDAPEFDLEKAAKGGGFPITPATPIEFETIQIGVNMTLTATIQSDGNIAIQAKTQITEFDDFINYGNSIVEVKTNPLGKVIPVTLTENRLLGPVFSTRSHENYMVIPNGGNYVMCDLSDTQEIVYEDRHPLGLYKKNTRETRRRQVLAIIRAERLE